VQQIIKFTTNYYYQGTKVRILQDRHWLFSYLYLIKNNIIFYSTIWKTATYSYKREYSDHCFIYL